MSAQPRQGEKTTITVETLKNVTKSEALRDISASTRATIIKHAHRTASIESRAHLYISDLSHGASIGTMLDHYPEEIRRLCSRLPLHIDRVLGPALSLEQVWCLYRAQYIYSRTIPDLSVSVRVIQQVEWRRQEDMLKGILELPGIHGASQLLVPTIEGDTIATLAALSTSALAGKLAKLNCHPHPNSKYIATFAPVHHANIFGWTRCANLGIRHLTIRILGASLWDHLYFDGDIAHYRGLPTIALVASIIAMQPWGMRSITLAGMMEFTSVFREMWDSIPSRTPFANEHPVLDMLVLYPFTATMDNIEEVCVERGVMVKRKRQGNLFGLKTPLQWQAMIMRARHDINSPLWEFTEKAWED